MLTNKVYERLTFRRNNSGMICDIGLKANSEEIAERLYALEEMIESGTLVFLPCKVGDSFFWIKRSYVGNSPIGEGKVNAFGFRDGKQVIYDGYNLPWELTKIYFTKEAAEKALEEVGVKR